MAISTRRVYWDACSWIALIQREKILLKDGSLEDREMLCRSVLEAAKKDKLEILASTLCLAEVCKNPKIRAEKRDDQIAAFFEQEYILLVNLDRFVGERARALMLGGHSKLKPADAAHLATALVSPGIEEFHTFDGRLIDLNGLLEKSDGTKLKICKPAPGVPPAPLLEAMRGKGQPEAPNGE
jgi:predicted nucleic acid-binding protein